MNLLDLPPEIVLLIAESLSGIDEIDRFARASRSLYRIVNKVLYDSMDKNKVLRWAARNGRGELISLVLDMGADIDSEDNDGRSALHWAATYAHDSHLITRLECGQEIHAVIKSDLHTVVPSDDYAVPTRILLDRGADISIKSAFRGRFVYHTALHWATACGNVAAVKLLLERGAEIDEQGGMVRYTPLILAAINDHESVVRLLLSKGADVRATTMWDETALHWASWAGHEEVAVALLENGAPIEDLGSDVQTPLIEAAREGHEGLVRILLENGANVDAHNVNHDTPLHIAVQKGFLRIVSLLLSYKAQIGIRSHTTTPLHSAAFMGHEAIVALLLDEGTDIGERLESNNHNLLHTAVVGHGDISLIKLLLDRGVSTTELTNDGETAVKLAHTRKKYDVVTTILADSPLSFLDCPEIVQNPATLDVAVRAAVQLLAFHGIPAAHYFTPLLYAACSEGLTDSVQILIYNGADVNFRLSSDNSPLLCAVSSGNEATVRLLLSEDARADDCHEFGYGYHGFNDIETPLRRAAVCGYVPIARALLECGADLHLRDMHGRTALHRAIMEGKEGRSEEMVRFLMSRGADPFKSDCEGVTAWGLAGEGWARKVLMEAGVADPYHHYKEEEMGAVDTS